VTADVFRKLGGGLTPCGNGHSSEVVVSVSLVLSLRVLRFDYKNVTT
jgi:hypothetical protein